jgi:hypothetical protein
MELRQRSGEEEANDMGRSDLLWRVREEDKANKRRVGK